MRFGCLEAAGAWADLVVWWCGVEAATLLLKEQLELLLTLVIWPPHL